MSRLPLLSPAASVTSWALTRQWCVGCAGVRELRVTAAVSAHDKDINAVAVSPNDAFVCTASQDRTAKVQQANFENVKPTSVGAA